jgi:hypothetical protein
MSEREEYPPGTFGKSEYVEIGMGADGGMTMKIDGKIVENRQVKSWERRPAKPGRTTLSRSQSAGDDIATITQTAGSLRSDVRRA